MTKLSKIFSLLRAVKPVAAIRSLRPVAALKSLRPSKLRERVGIIKRRLLINERVSTMTSRLDFRTVRRTIFLVATGAILINAGLFIFPLRVLASQVDRDAFGNIIPESSFTAAVKYAKTYFSREEWAAYIKGNYKTSPQFKAYQKSLTSFVYRQAPSFTVGLVVGGGLTYGVMGALGSAATASLVSTHLQQLEGCAIKIRQDALNIESLTGINMHVLTQLTQSVKDQSSCQRKLRMREKYK